MSKKKNRYNIEYYNGFMINAISLFISSYFPMQHIRPVDYQCFINKMVEKSVLHFFFFAERVQN